MGVLELYYLGSISKPLIFGISQASSLEVGSLEAGNFHTPAFLIGVVWELYGRLPPKLPICTGLRNGIRGDFV